MALHPVLTEKLNAALGPPAPPLLTRRDARLPAVPGKVHAEIGMRRAGKTTFLGQLLADRPPEGPVARARTLPKLRRRSAGRPRRGSARAAPRRVLSPPPRGYGTLRRLWLWSVPMRRGRRGPVASHVALPARFPSIRTEEALGIVPSVPAPLGKPSAPRPCPDGPFTTCSRCGSFGSGQVNLEVYPRRDTGWNWVGPGARGRITPHLVNPVIVSNLWRLGSKADTARDLASRLVTVCDRKKRAQETFSYNALVLNSLEVARVAREGGQTRATQGALSMHPDPDWPGWPCDP